MELSPPVSAVPLQQYKKIAADAKCISSVKFRKLSAAESKTQEKKIGKEGKRKGLKILNSQEKVYGEGELSRERK